MFDRVIFNCGSYVVSCVVFNCVSESSRRDKDPPSVPKAERSVELN